MKYNGLISVNENFQYSVNLQFDINNIEKVSRYIPTKDGCDVLKVYINSILNGKNRATTLIGPYGKGKSHLLLVLLMIISDYDKNDSIEINKFIEKIKPVDNELYDLIIDLRKKQIRLLPVIVNSNYNDLNQAFLLGLTDAFEREKIENVVTNNYYSVALNIIDDWESNHADVSDDIKNCLKNSKCSMSELKKGLKIFSKKHLDIFSEVYRCITRGQKFNPLVNTDIVKNFKDITYELNKIGYNGMFIAFDEFSKFLESSDSNHIMSDLKLLQDFAELADRTGKNEQIHLSCITHKGISEYTDNNDEKTNAFKTVEGRFKNIYFNRSMEQNYEIISYALEKKEKYDKFIETFIEKNAMFYLNIKELNAFKNVDNIEKILFKGCFPLNPITCYTLIELSEKIAQNERTLFTFLTDDDLDGLKRFINTESDNLFSINKIYDYFENVVKNSNDSNIKQIWVKAANALKKSISEDASRIVKSIAIIYMVNNLEELSTDDNTIKLSLMMDDSNYNKAVDELIEKSILRRKKITEELDFASSYSKKITNEIKDLVNTQFADINETDVLTEVIGKWYSLPRRYNEEFKITRFFENIFISENELMNLSSVDYLIENTDSDGLILNLVRTSKDIDILINHFKKISNNKVVLKISKICLNKKFLNLLKEYDAIDYMINQSELSMDEDNELVIIKQEVSNAIKDSFKFYYSSENIQEYIYGKEEYEHIQNISTLLSSICEEVYSKTPIVNNELINKNTLSAPIKKARDIVIETVLTGDNSLIKSKTSAEATIYKAIVEKINNSSIKSCLEVIKQFIQKTDNNKKSFEDLYSILQKEPYSIRMGIIPILLSIVISEFSDNIIIYYMNREVELDASTLIKINENPEKFYIITEPGTTDKINYVSELLKIFNIKSKTNKLRDNVHIAVESMKKWVLSLPRIIREAETDDSQKYFSNNYILVKNELLRPDLNNNEFLFKQLKEIFSTNDYNIILNEIKDMYCAFSNFITVFTSELINETIKTISPDYKGSLATVLQIWYKDLDKSIKNKIFDLNTKKFLNYIATINTHDDYEILNNLIRIVTGFYVEDWKISDKKNYFDGLNNILLKLNNSDVSSDSSQRLVLINGDNSIEKNLFSSEENISSLGVTMKNNIEEIIDEYGNSISEEEKINVLIEIMKKYM